MTDDMGNVWWGADIYRFLIEEAIQWNRDPDAPGYWQGYKAKMIPNNITDRLLKDAARWNVHFDVNEYFHHQKDRVPDVLMFIGRFSTDGRKIRKDTIETFTCGCCWWFAYILSVRFFEYNPRIMIDYVANHFGCKIGEEVYDITGIVTKEYKWKPWDECADEALKRRIIEDCIMF